MLLKVNTDLHLFGSVKQAMVFKYLCIIEFVYADQVNKSLAGSEISFQNNLYIFKLMMFDIQY